MSDTENQLSPAPSGQAKKTLFDYNASWPLLLVYIAYLIGMYFLQQWGVSENAGSYNVYAFVFLFFIIGLIATFIFYALGKIVFAKIAHYKVVTAKCFGFVYDGTKAKGTKGKLSFHITAILDFYLSFAPEDDDVEKDPLLIYVGGFVFEVIFIAICVTIFLIFEDAEPIVGWGALSALLYGGIVILYELMPFRQDNPNDMFNIVMTRMHDDKVAYNVSKINEKHEKTGEEFIVQTFGDYDSYYRSQMLYYIYLDHLYNNRLEDALTTLDWMWYLYKDIPEDKKYLWGEESMFLRALIGDFDGASRIFSTKMNSDYRRQVKHPTLLADYRTTVIIHANISRDKESLDAAVKEFTQLVNSYPENSRTSTEKTLFKQGLEACKTADPALEIPELNF